MSVCKPNTEIRENMPQMQKETVQDHMNKLGFTPLNDSGLYTIGANSRWSRIMARVDTLRRENCLPLHSHTFMEIFQYTSESRVECLIGTHRYYLSQGDIVCIPPGECHQVLRWEPEEITCTRNLIAVDLNCLEYIGWKNNLTDQCCILRGNDANLNFAGELCKICVRESSERNDQWKNVLLGCIQILLVQFQRYSGAAAKLEHDGYIEKILRYVDNNLDQKIRLSDVSKLFFISERAINRKFREDIGTSFYHYVTQRRMILAKALVLNGVPSEEVCRRVGYADYPTFYRAFKKMYGKSPRQVKLETRESAEQEKENQ